MKLSELFPRVIHTSIKSLQRYYLAYIIALGASICAIVIIMSVDYSLLWVELLATLALMFPLSLRAPLRAQTTTKKKRRIQLGGPILTLVGGGAFWYALNYYELMSAHAPQAYIAVIGLSYFIAVGVVFVRASINNPRIRDYRKSILFAFVIALVSGLIVWGGLAASLGSIEYLFDLQLNARRYQILGVVSVMIGGVTIFLNKLSRSDDKHHYDSFLRFFGLYVFLPLSGVYLIILLSYGLKILISGVRPKGLIVYMVIGYALRGLASYLLTYPLDTNSKWKDRLQTAYRVSMIVVVMLLFGAIAIRIADYGVTEARYLVVAIGLWMLISAGYNLWRQSLMSVFIIALGLAVLSAYSPWNVVRVSFDAQIDRFEGLLEEEGLRDGETLQMINRNVSDLSGEEEESYRALVDQTYYLEQHFGTGVFDSYYQTIDTDHVVQYQSPRGKNFVQTLGLTGDISELLYEVPTKGQYFSYYSQEHGTKIDTAGYSELYLLNHNSHINQANDKAINLSGPHNTTITLSKNEGEDLIIDLQSFASTIVGQANKHPQDKPLILNGDSYRIVVMSLNGEYTNDNTMTITYYDIILLVQDESRQTI